MRSAVGVCICVQILLVIVVPNYAVDFPKGNYVVNCFLFLFRFQLMMRTHNHREVILS